MQAPIFFFATCGTCYADRDNQISGYVSVGIYAKVSAVIVCRKPCFACGIAEFRKSRKKCGINGRRHTDFEEVCKYQRLICISNIYIRTYCEHRFVIAAVGKQQIKFDYNITRNCYVLRSENRSAHAFVIAFPCFGIQQFFRKVSVGTDYGKFLTAAVP